MKLLRFAVVAMSGLGIAACAYASARLAGLVPLGKLPPYPDWMWLHFIGATGFAVIAPLQLWPALRARRPALHRALGRTAVGCGAVMALSGIAIAWTAPDRPVSEQIFMTVFFAAYALFLSLGLSAALARDIAAHRAWMARMTATAFTPVTQRVLFPVFAAGFGIDGMATFWQLFISAAWIAFGLNLAIAEAWVHGPARKTRLAPA